jgi:hypothetical protein
MISFGKFLEIAINSDMAPPDVFNPGRASTSKVHAEDDPKHKIMPFVIHPRMIGPMEEVVGMRGMEKYGVAVKVLERILDQPRDGGMLVVAISNLESDSLSRMGSEFIKDSEKVMASRVGDSMRDEAMRWISFGNDLLRSVKNGVDAASRKVNS